MREQNTRHNLHWSLHATATTTTPMNNNNNKFRTHIPNAKEQLMFLIVIVFRSRVVKMY